MARTASRKRATGRESMAGQARACVRETQGCGHTKGSGSRDAVPRSSGGRSRTSEPGRLRCGAGEERKERRTSRSHRHREGNIYEDRVSGRGTRTARAAQGAGAAVLTEIPNTTGHESQLSQAAAADRPLCAGGRPRAPVEWGSFLGGSPSLMHVPHCGWLLPNTGVPGRGPAEAPRSRRPFQSVGFDGARPSSHRPS